MIFHHIDRLPTRNDCFALDLVQPFLVRKNTGSWRERYI
jgi:hypothetical protein